MIRAGPFLDGNVHVRVLREALRSDVEEILAFVGILGVIGIRKSDQQIDLGLEEVNNGCAPPR
jgi:hypothetical protein